MELERKSLRVGVAVIACAAVLKLAGSGFFQPVAALMKKPETVSFLLYLQTGRVIRASPAPTIPEPTAPSLPPETTAPVLREPVKHTFSEADAELLSVHYYCDYKPDLSALLLRELDIELRSDQPTVLILHTHATESYAKAPGDAYQESSPYRTLDESYNMISIGARVARLLEEGGIHVLHDTTLHDYPSYNSSYSNARDTIKDYLTRYPSIRLVLDLHRDALSLDVDTQLSTSTTVDGQPSAQLMMVVGTDAGGLYHPGWQDNLSLAVKLHAVLEKQWPGLCRAISFRSQRFNQDLSPGAMLIEIGAAGDTHEKALAAADALAKGLLTLADGTVTEHSSS